MPLISVIIPIYNTGQYLQEAIHSILDQNIDDIEIICVNDGSTDESLAILNSIAEHDNRFIVLSQSNQGQSVARNTGLKQATGQYIYFMDSDDKLHPGCFQQCLQHMEQNNYDFLFFDGDILCEKGTPNICWNYQRTAIYEEGKAYNGEALLNSLLNNYTHRAVPWLLFIRHDYLQSISLNFYPGIIHEDELFTTLLTIQAKKVGCIKDSFVHHRVRPNSTMTHAYSRHNVDCYLTVIDQLMNWGRLHHEQMPILRKYALYTLDKVFLTAHCLPFRQKISLTVLMIRKKYTNFVSRKNWLRFYLK